MRRSEQLLLEMRSRWAAREHPAPASWLPPKPQWFDGADNLRGLAIGEALLYEVGQVRWGRVLMANNVLWKAGPDTAPGEVLWSPDPYVVANPEWLGGPAAAYWWLKDPPKVDEDRVMRTDVPGWLALYPFAHDEHRIAKRRRFPPLLARRRVVYHDVVLFYRQDLPGGRLVDNVVPILTADEPTPTRLLPPRFWADDLRTEWERSVEEGEEAE